MWRTFKRSSKMATEEAVGVPTVHEDDRKLFVGALPQEAKDTDIKEYFETYGEIDSINLKMDQTTGRSRGFAFVVFKTVEGIEAALQQEAHVVKGKKVTCKKAEARQGKVYVGKLPPGEAMSKEELQEHFSQYGEVVEVVRPVDKMKNNEPKTFAFITFAREETAKQLVKQGSTVVGEFSLEIKKVTPKDPSGGYQGWGGAGWGGAAWGGGYGGYGGYGGGYGMDYGYGGYEGY